MKDVTSLYSDVYERFYISVDDSSYEETSESLRIFDTEVSNDDDLQCLAQFKKAISDKEIGEVTIEGGITGEININEVELEQVQKENFRITVNKKSDSFVYFFNLKAFSKKLGSEQFVYDKPRIYINENFESFYTYSNKFASFDELLSSEQTTDFEFNGLKDPRFLVRDLTTAANVLPPDLSCWFLRNQGSESQVLSIWKKQAAINLSFSLPLQLIDKEDHYEVVLRDEKFHSFNVASKDSEVWENTYPIISDTAYWVYKNKDEAESKHSILNYHLAIEWSGNDTYPEREKLAKSFTNAKQAYKLHLHESSREVLRSLGQLRETLFDEVEKVKENTKSLLERLWRDFAIVLGVLIIRFVPNLSQIQDDYLNYLSYGTAGFITLSITITVISNFFFNRSSKKNRKKWRDKTFFFISNEEFEEIYETPIKSNMWTFRVVQTIIILAYVGLAILLIYLPGIAK